MFFTFRGVTGIAFSAMTHSPITCGTEAGLELFCSGSGITEELCSFCSLLCPPAPPNLDYKTDKAQNHGHKTHYCTVHCTVYYNQLSNIKRGGEFLKSCRLLFSFLPSVILIGFWCPDWGTGRGKIENDKMIISILCPLRGMGSQGWLVLMAGVVLWCLFYWQMVLTSHPWPAPQTSHAIYRQTGRQEDKHASSQEDIQGNWQTYKPAGRPTGRQTGRQSYRQAGGHACMYAGRNTCMQAVTQEAWLLSRQTYTLYIQ